MKTTNNKNDTLTNRPNLQRQCVQNKSICRTESYQSSIDKKEEYKNQALAKNTKTSFGKKRKTKCKKR